MNWSILNYDINLTKIYIYPYVWNNWLRNQQESWAHSPKAIGYCNVFEIFVLYQWFIDESLGSANSGHSLHFQT